MLESLKGEFFINWLGEYLTAPLRMRMRSPSSFFVVTNQTKTTGNQNDNNDDSSHTTDHSEDEGEEGEYDDELDGLPLSVGSDRYSIVSKRVFHHVHEVYDQFMTNQIQLRRLEGTRIAHCGGNRLYIDGQVFSISLIGYDEHHNDMENNSSIACIFRLITRSNRLNFPDFQQQIF